jgi:DNA ligase-4
MLPVLTIYLQVKVFDILMINGKSLLERSTVSRKENLMNAVTEVKGRLQLATVWRGKAAKDVRNRMDQVMEARSILPSWLSLL